MTRHDLILAILAAADGRPYTPVQIQKAAFLVVENLPGIVTHGPNYDFAAYDYGPFDSTVYSDIEMLRRRGLAEVTQAPGARWNRYAADEGGLTAGRSILDSMEPRAKSYVKSVSDWVRSQTFEQLVKSIYDAYPAMRANSIFRG